MSEADIWKLIIAVLRAGLDAQGFPLIKIKQSFQPIKHGSSNDDVVYLFKVTSRQYGFQNNKKVYNAGNANFDVVENKIMEPTFQLTAQIVRDITDEDQLTSYDIADKCASIMQSSKTIKELKKSDVGILRVTDVRNPYALDDKDQFNQDPSFDFVLTYTQGLISTEPAADAVEPNIKQV